MEQNVGFPKKEKNILLNQVFKLKFSNSVGEDWKTLGRWLNINDSYLGMIDQDNTKTVEKAYNMLSKWMEMNKNPTLEELKTSLKNMERFDLIRKLEELATWAVVDVTKITTITTKNSTARTTMTTISAATM
ncbi:uncharacterized protein LOC105848458 isoform X2 [Hydra vulgaris]